MMKHIQTVSVGKAYSIGIGHYLTIAGQILGILAMMFAEKPEVPPDFNDGNGNGNGES